jgi:hypothetical protein
LEIASESPYTTRESGDRTFGCAWGLNGSIYVGLLVGAPNTGRFGFKEVENREATVSFSKGEPLAGKSLLPSSRVSFKASGEIHLGNRVLRGRPLEGLSSPLQLCVVTFVHPSRYRLPPKKNQNDYDVGIAGFPIDVDRPTYGAIFVSPWPIDGALNRIRVKNMTFQCDILLGFRNLARTPDLALQIAIGHGPKGQWPNLPAIAVLERK